MDDMRADSFKAARSLETISAAVTVDSKNVPSAVAADVRRRKSSCGKNPPRHLGGYEMVVCSAFALTIRSKKDAILLKTHDCQKV